MRILTEFLEWYSYIYSIFTKGKGGEEELKSMVSTIHNIKEKLKGENDELKKIKHKLKEIQEKQKAEKEVIATWNDYKCLVYVYELFLILS